MNIASGWSSAELFLKLEKLTDNITERSSQKFEDIFVLYCFLARLYESTGRALAVTPALALASASLKCKKFLVKVFRSLYLLKL